MPQDAKMESANSTPSRIPRSRLPVPRTTPNTRSSTSRESLTASDSIKIPRLKGTPSRDQLLSLNKRGSLFGPAKFPPNIGIQSGDKQELDLRTPLHSDLEQSKHISNAEEAIVSVEDGKTPRKPRQSLSERTMETLAQLPASPAVRRRESSFFNPDSPMRPPSRAASNSRPGSSYQQDTSMGPPPRSVGSRPSSSAGYKGEAVPIDFRASTNTFKPPKSYIANETLKSPTTTKTPLRVKSNVNLRSSVTPSKLIPPTANIKNVKPSTPIKITPKLGPIKSGSKTVGSRPVKPRAPINGLFRKPSMPEIDKESPVMEPTLKKPALSLPKVPSKVTSLRSKKSPSSVLDSSSPVDPVDPSLTPRKSSLALREQIAKAKAAKRAQSSRQSLGQQVAELQGEVSIIPEGTFDFGLGDDPFNQQRNQDGAKGLLRKRIDGARTDGRLNIAGMGLKEIPPEVMDMYNFDAINGNGGSWAESVDLTRFVAADNEFEILGDNVFPDVDPSELLNDDDSKGNQFGGLETLDLHGNLLKALPLGLRRLNLLTTLNLSYNKLDNTSFDVISQITSLRDLKVGNNDLTGDLSNIISKLCNLEVLDVRRNRLTCLPESLVELVRLRILNLSENVFTSLPFDTLQQLPLIELSAAKNSLEGVLIRNEDAELPQLQVLDVSGNSLTSLALKELRLPSLHQLSCASNRLTSLPNMSSWQSLLTLAAEDNNISSIPEGFTSLAKVKNVDLTGNSIRILDDNIGRMENLDIFRISGNPLREKKFSSMTADELKRVLSARLAPIEIEAGLEESSEVFTSCPSSPTRPNPATWLVKAGGILDRSNNQLSSLDVAVMTETAANHSVRVLDLRHNQFREIPDSLRLFSSSLTTLILSHNEFANDTFLKDDLELPFLKELNVSSNTFTSLLPLTVHLQAPSLEKLDISFNRLPSLPILRVFFPQLTVVLASNNSIKELHPEAVKGLKILDASSNDVESLNPRIGLLGGPGGLERLDVSGNRFRVPKYTVLEKGTEATLMWLRDRIPVGEEGGLGDVD